MPLLYVLRGRLRSTIRLISFWYDHKKRWQLRYGNYNCTFAEYLKTVRAQAREQLIYRDHCIAVKGERVLVYQWLDQAFEYPRRMKCDRCGEHMDFQWNTYRCRMPNGHLSRTQAIFATCRKCNEEQFSRFAWAHGRFVEPRGRRSLDEIKRTSRIKYI